MPWYTDVQKKNIKTYCILKIQINSFLKQFGRFVLSNSVSVSNEILQKNMQFVQDARIKKNNNKSKIYTPLYSA